MPSPEDLPDIEIGYSMPRLLRLIGLGVLMTLVSAAMAFNWYHTNIGAFRTAVGYLGVVGFGFATCVALWLLISSRGPVIFISRDGIRDTRIADELIAWSSVEKISIWQYRSQKSVVLKLNPAVARRLFASSLRRFSLLAAKTFGVDGVTVNTAALTMDTETLLDTCRRYSAAAGSGQLGA
jgi:hypothetical protein